MNTAKRKCKVKGCDEYVQAKGLCYFHYQRKRRGRPLDTPKGEINGTVYKITTLKSLGRIPSGFRVVGITMKPIQERFQGYIQQAYSRDDQGPLYKYIRKHISKDVTVTHLGKGVYGVKGLITIQAIMAGIRTPDALSKSEDPFIQLLDTMWPNGYNRKRGGGYSLHYNNTYGSTCSHPGCDEPHASKGLCALHYNRKQKGFSIDAPKQVQVKSESGVCSQPGCDEPHRAKGLCHFHYERQRKDILLDAPRHEKLKSKSGVCNQPGCDEPHKAKGLCLFHYRRKQAGVPLDAPKRKLKPKPKRKCKVKGCDKLHMAKGLCGFHYGRKYNGTHINAPKQVQVKSESGVCNQPGCGKPHAAKGLCRFHYKRQRNGTPLDAPMQKRRASA